MIERFRYLNQALLTERIRQLKQSDAESWAIAQLVEDVFKSGIDGAMDFSEALERIKMGYKVARSGGNGKNMFLFLADKQWFGYHDRPSNLADFIAIQAADGKVYPWLASQQDLLSTDWEVFNAASRHAVDAPELGEVVSVPKPE